MKKPRNLPTALKNKNKVNKSNQQIPFEEIQEQSNLKLAQAIFTDPSWVLRVNEVRVFDNDSLSNHNYYSLDCLINEKFPRYDEILPTTDTGFTPEKGRLYCIPIGLLKKRQILNLDITHEGKSCPTPTSLENIEIAKNILIQFVNEYIRKRIETNLFNEILEKLQQLIFKTCESTSYSDSHNLPDEPKPQDQLSHIFNRKLIERNQEKLKLSEIETNQLKDSIDLLAQILTILKENFILFALIPTTAKQRTIIKYSFEVGINEDSSLFNENINHSKNNDLQTNFFDILSSRFFSYVKPHEVTFEESYRIWKYEAYSKVGTHPTPTN